MSNQQIGKVKPANFDVLRPRMLAVGLPNEQVQKEISFAVQQINANKYLQSCSAESVMMAVVNSANIGLTLNPAAKEAFLIPRQGVAVLDPSYVGLIKLIVQAGAVKSIIANVVYEVDRFELNIADNINPINHQPFLKAGRTKSELLGFYALATFADGTKQAEWMDIEAVHAVRATSESYKAMEAGKLRPSFCIWHSHHDEMGRKTVIKRLYKYLPRTAGGLEKVDKVIEIDNQEYGITFNQANMIENLLMATTLDFEETQHIFNTMQEMSHSEANACIKRLKENQSPSLVRQSDVDRQIADRVAAADFYENE